MELSLQKAIISNGFLIIYIEQVTVRENNEHGRIMKRALAQFDAETIR